MEHYRQKSNCSGLKNEKWEAEKQTSLLKSSAVTSCGTHALGIPLSNKQKGTVDTRDDLDTCPGSYAKWKSQSLQVTHCMFPWNLNEKGGRLSMSVSWLSYLNCSFIKCYHWRKLGKAYRDFVLTTACESVIISIKTSEYSVTYTRVIINVVHWVITAMSCSCGIETMWKIYFILK